ncbi:hypothetical protein TNCV_3231401 [Trichonephila clavipes]|nr:hypothetical protein TNCV_3231401 [Trichonephila clavipes]
MQGAVRRGCTYGGERASLTNSRDYITIGPVETASAERGSLMSALGVHKDRTCVSTPQLDRSSTAGFCNTAARVPRPVK